MMRLVMMIGTRMVSLCVNAKSIDKNGGFIREFFFWAWLTWELTTQSGFNEKTRDTYLLNIMMRNRCDSIHVESNVWRNDPASERTGKRREKSMGWLAMIDWFFSALVCLCMCDEHGGRQSHEQEKKGWRRAKMTSERESEIHSLIHSVECPSQNFFPIFSSRNLNPNILKTTTRVISS